MEENQSKPWEFAGWGNSTLIKEFENSPAEVRNLDQTEKHKLGKWASTAICGNDITSSCLYVSALCAVYAGHLAPIVLLVVAGVLFLFRKVYAEVGSALPLNGGTYTVLLNTTNKKMAAIAACLTILSYVATAVISAGEAMHYAHSIYESFNVFYATIGLLAFFAILNLIGISESAVVALGIFIFHMLTLTVLVIAAGIMVIGDTTTLSSNWNIPSTNGLMHALFFGFAAAMLGISGFESSANFIEEQKKGVFPKTLNNMWIAVAIFNPLISFLAIGILPLIDIQGHGPIPTELLNQVTELKNIPNDVITALSNVANGIDSELLKQLKHLHESGTIPANIFEKLKEITPVPENLLAIMGEKVGGSLLKTIVSIDAVLVLSGAVLTSYVGVIGLIRRMTLDRCMPQFLLAQNKIRKTNHWIIIAFLSMCISILFITGGKVSTLAGVYTLSFLCVMGLFAIGNMLLKSKRGKLPRDVRASWSLVTIALIAIIVGIVGNVMLKPEYVKIFLQYFVAIGLLVAVMFLRIPLLKAGLFISNAVIEKIKRVSEYIYSTITTVIEKVNGITVVYFTKNDDLATLNKAALYVLNNEQTKRLKVVHVNQFIEDIPQELAEHLTTIDRMYPQLRIDFVAVKGEFTPEIIQQISDLMNVPKNYMFIGTPGDKFPHRVADLGGVRLII